MKGSEILIKKREKKKETNRLHNSLKVERRDFLSGRSSRKESPIGT